jgi:hypothetical protein
MQIEGMTCLDLDEAAAPATEEWKPMAIGLIGKE